MAVERASAQARTWTRERVAAEVYELLSAVVRGDTHRLLELVELYGQERASHLPGLPLPLDPWTDPSVAYGAIVTLLETASIGVRIAVPPDVLADILGASEARNILLALAEEPGGMIRQSDIPALTGIARSNAHHELQYLLEKDLMVRRAADRREKVYTLELTRKGWSVVETLRRIGVQRRDTNIGEMLKKASYESIARILRSKVSDTRAAVEVGRQLSDAASDSSMRRRLSKILVRCFRELDPEPSARLFLSLLRAGPEHIVGRDPVRRRQLLRYMQAIRESDVEEVDRVYHRLSEELLDQSWLSEAAKAWDTRIHEDATAVASALREAAEEIVGRVGK